MKTKLALSLLSTLCFQLSLLAQGTAFTYQGKLTDGPNPASGSYDLRCTLYDSSGGPTVVAGPLTNAATLVSAGLFTVALDFGPGIFTGPARWLEIGVRTNGAGAFTTLSPRQALTPAPYAVYTPSAGTALTATTAATASSVAAANVSGTLALAQMPAPVITNNATGVTLGGTFSGSGVGLTSVNADLVDGQHGAFYQNATNLTSGTLADARLSSGVALRGTTNTFTGTNAFTKPVGIDCLIPGRPLQVGNPNTFGSQGMIRIASRSTNSPESRVWDIGVPQTGSDTSGVGYSFVIDDTQLGSDPEFVVRWGNGRVGIGRTNPATALDVNGTVTATGYAGNGAGLTNLSAAQLAGTLSFAQLPGALVTNNATGLNLTGTFSGNGAGVTNVDLFTVNSRGAIGWATNWGNFLLASSPGVGSLPMSVVAADVNGDGKLDLVCANTGDNTLSVLTNNGSGGFVLAASPAVGVAPQSVVAADVNADGKADLICANSAANTLSVLTNNGSGGFVLASSPGVGVQPLSVTAADVNGDGKVDLISVNFTSSSFSVLTNNGSGGFALASSPLAGGSPYAVAAADVNGDAKVDLISASLAGNRLWVLTNNGSGGFVLSSQPGVGNGPVWVKAADVNGDGKVDLITANQTANTLSVLTNDGSGGFVVASTPALGGTPRAITVADANGDGKVELICANGNSLTVLTNNGSSAFVPASSFAVGVNPNSVAAADLNGDGQIDLACANGGGTMLSVLFNTVSAYTGAFQGNFTGDGSGLRNLDATDLTGTVADARLSANVALLNANQAFTGPNRFAGVVTLTNTGNLLSGNGGGLTNLNASQLAIGTVPLAQLPDALVTNNETGLTLAGTFSGNGAGLTNVPSALAWQTVSGTSQTVLPNAAYLLTNNAPVTVTLPSSPNLGDVVRVSGAGAGGWKIAQNSGQAILVGNIPGTLNAIGANWTARASSQAWGAVASSADGTKLVAAVSGGMAGYIYTSTDAGVSWTAHTAPGSLYWYSVASSADGSKLVGVVQNGRIYTSSDSGATWTPRAISTNWVSVASSADGTKLVAAVFTGQLYTSTDSGTNWTARASAQGWGSVASSADGTKLVAAVQSGQIYTSIDSGVNWAAHAGSLLWNALASSADGTKVAAAVYGGQLWTSTDSGTNWTARASSQNWRSIASSADGTRLVAVVGNGQVYTSLDSGVSWTARASSLNWYSVAGSADGTRLVAVVQSGQIYTSVPSTTVGAAGYLTGGQYGAIELQCVGGGVFLPLSYSGTLSAY